MATLTFEGAAEDLQVTHVHDVYPTIDPQSAYGSQLYKDKVVLITGATGGIGANTAKVYARAGGSLILSSRQTDVLASVKQEILNEMPSAKVLTVQGDVVDPKAAEQIVKAGLDAFGKLDIVIANAGKALKWEKPLAQSDAEEWWSCLEVNLRGVYNIVRYSLPSLISNKGYIIAVTAMAAQLRIPLSSAYATSKHAINRFVEFVHLEHPEVHIFSLHPGAIKTPLSLEANKQFESHLVDTLDLPSCTMAYLTSGKADWLAGRYVSSNWDLGEVEAKYKNEILEKGYLVNRLSVP